MKVRIVQALLVVLGLAAFPSLSRAVVQPPKQNPLAAQQKAVHDAEINLATAKKQFLVIRKRVELSFSSKPEWKTAKDAQEKAKADYEVEMRKVTAALEKDPAYVALAAKRDKAQATIDQAHAPVVASASGDDPVKLTDDDINAAVKDHQDAVLAMKEMEKHAEENDANFATLSQKKTEAQTTWDALQSQVDDAVKLDKDYPAAQQAVDQAEQSLKQAKDALASASKAQRDASHTAHPPSSGIR